MTRSVRVLHVDDDPSITDLTATYLEREDDQFTVETATNAEDGLKTISDRPPDCVVSDYEMPGLNGIEFLQAVREEYPDLPFILYTGKGSEAVASDAIAADVTDYLQKSSGSEQYELLANRIRNAVHARREAERAGRQKQLMRLTEFAGDTGGFELHRETNTVTLTAGARRIIGRPDQRKLSLEEGLELVHPDDREQIQQTLDKAVETGDKLSGTLRLQLDGGDERLLEVTITPVVENGEVRTLRGAGHDITDRKARREELEEYETIIEALTDAVYVLDENGRFTYINDEFVELTGYDRETILGSTPSLVKDEDAVEQAEHQLSRLLSHQGPDAVTFEVTIQPRDGEPIVCEDHMGVLPYDGEEFEGSVGTLRDITERKERQRELVQTRDLLRNMEELADAGAWQYNPETANLAITDGTRRLYGLDPDADLTFEESLTAVHPDDRDGLRDRVETCLETGDSYEMDIRFTAPDGEQRWLTARGERLTGGDTASVRGYLHDITERKQRQRDLRQERDLITGIVETSPVGIAVVTADGTLSFVNDRAESISGWSAKESEDSLMHHPRYDFVDEEGEPFETDSDKTPFDRVMSRESIVRDQVIGIRRPSGDRVWLSVNGSPQYNDQGELERAVFAFEDITEQKEREREVQDLNERLELAVDGANLGVWDWDMRTDDVEFNDNWATMLGYEPDEIGSHLDEWEHRVHPDDRELVEDALDEHIAGETEYYDTEHRMRAADGGWKWIRDVGKIFERDEDGNPTRAVGIHIDIDERKTSRRALEEERDMFAEGPAVVFKWREAEGWPIEYVSDTVEEVFGYESDAFETGEITAIELIHEEDRERVAREVERNSDLETDRFSHDPYRVVTADDDVRWVLDHTKNIREDGEITHRLGYLVDITEQKQRESELQRQNKRLDTFASVVSHDLRNPLNVAEGRLELAIEECNSQHLEHVSAAHDRMDELIEDLLQLARHGRQIGEREDVSLSEVVKSCWSNVSTEDATLVSETDRTIRANRSQLQQVFENLFRNAVEHAGEDVAVIVGDHSDGFFIEDDGPGIPTEKRAEVFEPGYSTGEESTGFGLAIVAEIVNAHGWTVRVTDGKTGGTRFEITDVDLID